jgi:predicted RNase H-like nuclease (RuvC/YqgF family)
MIGLYNLRNLLVYKMQEDNKKEGGRDISGNSKQKHPVQRKSPYDDALSSFNEQVNTLIRTIRILEERYSNLRKKTQITDQNMIEDVKRISTNIKLLDSEISEMKKQFIEVDEKISILFDQLKSSVNKEDLEVLDRYLNMWNPMSFVTFEEAKRIIKENK